MEVSTPSEFLSRVEFRIDGWQYCVPGNRTILHTELPGTFLKQGFRSVPKRDAGRAGVWRR